MSPAPDQRAHQDAHQSANPHRRIAKAENGVAISRGHIPVGGKVHGTLDEQPFMPGRIEGMIHSKPGGTVVIVHILLHPDDLLQEVPQGEFPIACHLRNVAEQINCHRYQNEKHHAPQAQPNQPRQRFPAAPYERLPLILAQTACRGQQLLGLIRQANMPPAGPAEQYRQPGTGIQPDPLAGNPQANGYTAPGEVGEHGFHASHQVPLHKAKHKEEAHHDKQHRKAVNGGNARLGQMHAVQRQQRHSGKGQIPPLG